MTSTINYAREMPNTLKALGAIQQEIHQDMQAQGFDKGLSHLVLLRASQINGCGYCVEMHTREARADGETNERLDKLIVWSQVEDFNLREKLAFGWTEALTSLEHKSDLGSLRTELKAHFSDKEISLLTAYIAMINLWNRIQISAH